MTINIQNIDRIRSLKTRKLLIASFSMLLISFFLISTISFLTMREQHQQINTVVNYQNTIIQNISRLQNIARERLIIISQMPLAQDEFFAEEGRAEMLNLASNFLKIRDALLANQLRVEDETRLKAIFEMAYASTRQQRSALQMIEAGHYDAAKQQIIEKVTPYQSLLISAYQDFLNDLQKEAEIYAKESDISYLNSVTAIIILNLIGVIIGYTIAHYASNKTHQYESELIELNETLEDKVQERTKQLDEEKQKAVQASEEKTRFVSGLSHELKTPLNAIQGYTQLLQLEELNKRQHDYCGEIFTASEHLHQITNQVLDVAKIEAGVIELDIQPLCINQLIEECMSMIRCEATARKIEISMEKQETGMIKADHTRLRQVILNLLSNGIKYNNDNGWIKISFDETIENRLKILISDNGQGISLRQQQNLFQEYNRLDANESKIEGNGLGLTISKKLVEAMGGTIGITSELNKGSTFWLEMEREAGNC